MTMANTVVRARIDEKTKEEAAAVLAAMGLTVSDAFRLMLIRIAREKALPFEPLLQARRGYAATRAARLAWRAWALTPATSGRIEQR
jgi:DNA-damage-inducible protein J